MKIRELFVRLGVRADEDKIRNFERRVRRLKRALKELVSWLAKVAAGLTALALSAGVVTQKTAEYAEEVQRSAMSMGMAVERYQELRFGMEQLGGSATDLNDLMSTLSDRAEAAANGSAHYRKELEKAGIEVESFLELDAGARMTTWIEAVRGMGSETAALAHGTSILGYDLRRRVMPAVLSTSDSFEAFQQMAHEANIVMSKDQIEAAKKSQRRWRLFKATIVGFGRMLAMEMLPTFDLMLDRFRLWTKANSDAIKSGIKRFAEELTEQIEKLYQWFSRLDDTVRGMGGWGKVLENFVRGISSSILLITAGKIVKVIAMIGPWLKAIAKFGVAASVKVAFLVGLVAFLILLVEDFFVWLSGGESVIGNIVDRFGEGNGALDQMVKLVKAGLEFWEAIAPAVEWVASALWNIIVHALKVAWNSLKFILQVIGAILQAVLEWGTAFARFIGDVISGKKTISEAFSDLRSDLLAGTLNLLANILGAVANSVLGMIEILSDTFGGWFTEFYDDAVGVVDKIMTAIRGAFAEIPGMVKKAFASVPGKLKTVLGIGTTGAAPSHARHAKGRAGMGGLDAFMADRNREIMTNNSSSNKSVRTGDFNINIDGSTGEAIDESARRGFEMLFGDVVKQADASLAGGER